MSTTKHFSKNLAVELWTLYSLGLLFIACRIIARRLHLRSFTKFQADDYVMLIVVLTYTGVILTTDQVAKNGSNYSHLSPGAAAILNEEELNDAIWGSKMTFLLEEFLITTLWLLKGCILIMYHRLTLGLWQHTAVKLLAAYCVIGFVVMQILLFGVWCKPFSQYWAVPPNNTQCATYFHHMIAASVFNISSDLLILGIPIPMLIKSMMPVRRKIILCGVFGLGIFVILAAVLNRYYNFSQKYSLIFLNWYVGEVFSAICVANIPLCWPLVRRIVSADSWGSCSSTNNSRNTDSSNRELRQAQSKGPSIRPVTDTTLRTVTTTATLDDLRGKPRSRRASTLNDRIMGLDEMDLEMGVMPPAAAHFNGRGDAINTIPESSPERDELGGEAVIPGLQGPAKPATVHMESHVRRQSEVLEAGVQRQSIENIVIEQADDSTRVSPYS